MDGFMVALCVGIFGGLVNLLIDIPAAWHYDWSTGPPSYQDLINTRHRHLHTPSFCILITLPLWLGFVALTNGLGVGQILPETDPTIITILNILYYMFPYVIMILYDLSPKTPERVKNILTKIGSLSLLAGVFISCVSLVLFGYYKDGQFVAILGFMPPYLAIYYSVGLLFCAWVIFTRGYSWYHSLLLGSVLTYVSSFYWEIPENVYWLLVRGFSPVVIFILLGAFPYIWLDKKLGWKKSRRNVLLVLLGWVVTTYGVLTMESNIFTTPLGGLYFLFCRVICLAALVKVFILDKERMSDSGA
jgi:hypothetical protein